MIKFGLMEYALIDENTSSEQAYYNSIKIAKIAEKLNADSFWIAEHHNVYALGSTNPSLLMLEIANKTKKIKLGSAGIMLSHYSPLKVAEDIFIMMILKPSRFYFGIGSNPGTEIVQKEMLTVSNYHEKWIELLHYLDIKIKKINAPKAISIPKTKQKANLYMLICSVEGAKFAANNKLNIIYGFFLNHDWNIFEKALETYRKIWQEKYKNDQYDIAFAINVVVAKTKKKANELIKSFNLFILGKKEFNEFNNFPSLKQANSYKYSEQDLEQIKQNKNKNIIGDTEEVKKQILEIAKKYQINNFICAQLLSDNKNRIKNIKQIANIFNEINTTKKRNKNEKN
ncbi:MsnO8 family LLM class oxidoreductase [Mycoplasmopsis cricetuli]|uniref:MsnO8 family LLM class oxidoreductase n=1 Tax=Mycoplasmopsis cricetuli TaxID=171283 RepID=UPI00047219F2|nr:MsnO8 family LLM class oxidoreductase [Mycoplasmopsis cricetuli]